MDVDVHDPRRDLEHVELLARGRTIAEPIDPRAGTRQAPSAGRHSTIGLYICGGSQRG